jgi:glycosyltransferase involved in cell wall biosynthesis
MPRPRGTGRNLRDAYRLIPALRPEWEFVLYHQREAGVAAGRGNSADSDSASLASAVLSSPNMRTRRIDLPGDRFDLWFQVRLPAAAWRDRVDLLHLPANAAPARCPLPFVVTVHDLIPLTLAGELPATRRRAFQRGVERAVRGAMHIISPSNATRDELHRVFGVPLEKITVIPWAPDQGITAVLDSGTVPAQIERVRARYHLDRPWLLNFSGSSPRKNAAALIDAFARLSPDVHHDVELVLVGCEPASVRAEFEARSVRLGVRASCRFLGFVPHEDLPGLLCGARGLVMPSLCEGFGLPILDAFACSTPVLTSNLSSMPEVAGDAAIYCDPRNATSIAGGIVQLLDPTVAEPLKRAGAQRLRHFSWEQTARLMCEVYERGASGRLRRVTRRSVTAMRPPETCGAEI